MTEAELNLSVKALLAGLSESEYAGYLMGHRAGMMKLSSDGMPQFKTFPLEAMLEPEKKP